MAVAAAAGLCLLAGACGGGGQAGAALPARPAAPVRPPVPALDPTGTVPHGSADVTIGKDRDQGHVAMTLYQTLAVRLDGNPATGYVWELQQVEPAAERGGSGGSSPQGSHAAERGGSALSSPQGSPRGEPQAVLRPDGEVTYTSATGPSGRPMPGAGGVFTARFTPLRRGRAWLKMVYQRPFQNGKAPAWTFAVHVMVR